MSSTADSAQRPAPDSRIHYMLTAPVAAMLLRLSTPNIAFVLTQTAVTIADAWYVGQLGTTALASLAVVFPVQALMQMMSAGAMGGGISSAVARAMGRGQSERAAALAVHALIIACLMAVIYTLFAGVFARELFALLGARDEVLEGSVRYANIAFGGCIMMWLTNTLASVLRGTGNMSVPGIVMIAAQLLHVAVSGALTLGWGPFPMMGIAGPAIALVSTFFLATLVLGVYIFSAHAKVHIRFDAQRFNRGYLYDILKVGAPACLNALLTVATVFIVTRLVSSQGTAALAGYGLGSRLELLIVPLAFGIGATLTASVGANFGAQQFARARHIAMVGGGVIFTLITVFGVIIGFAPQLWLMHFSADPQVHAIGESYLHIVAPSYGFFAAGMALYFASQGTGNMRWPLTAGSLRLVIAAGGGAIISVGYGMGVEAIFVCVAIGLVIFGAIIAWSLRSRVWNPERSD